MRRQSRVDSGALSQGQVLAGRYQVEEVIGRGGMGLVYRARHGALNKTVAVKVLRDELLANRQALARFHQEAVAAASIGHPGIVNVTDYGFTEEGQAFLVMEHLRGRDLADVLAESGALTPLRATALARKILAPLAAAHAQGIIHRDLKTNNVFVLEGRDDEDEQIKLLDFGISKVIQQEKDPGTGLTSQGAILGTPRYLAPEQAQGDTVDERSDIYALGVVLYEMLTGQVPFSGRSALEVLFAHVQKQPEPPRERRPDLPIPSELEAIVLKALAKAPEERFDSAQEMDKALADAELATARLAELRPLRPARGGRRGALVGLGAAAVVCLVGLGIWVAGPKAVVPATPIIQSPARPKTPPPKSPTSKALTSKAPTSKAAAPGGAIEHGTVAAAADAGVADARPRDISAATTIAKKPKGKKPQLGRRLPRKKTLPAEKLPSGKLQPGDLDPGGNPYAKKPKKPEKRR